MPCYAYATKNISKILPHVKSTDICLKWCRWPHFFFYFFSSTYHLQLICQKYQKYVRNIWKHQHFTLQCHFWIPWTICCKMHSFFQAHIDYFEIHILGRRCFTTFNILCFWSYILYFSCTVVWAHVIALITK